ncbi:DMT family transporter [Caldibacillus lycopersici]|uniref:DMT family transporter n=1 Tax=Perspicuibacillus lycopersici TaxID=1325689 RepID=A0AAE3IT11_9BACI|nr:DMT family transporter [Perspicuibacillus lycopersici]MCU9613652.1 DMT family transporter [Perspicuibacillus lycopersici]
MNKTKLADIILLLVAFIWGATFVIVQNAISFLPPHTFNCIRFLFATCFLASWLLLFHREELKQFNKKVFFAGFILGLWLFIGYAFQTLGLVYTTSSKAGFITGLSVVLVPLFTFLIFQIKPKIQAVLGVVLATAGLYMLTLSGNSSLNIGDLFVLICALGFALHIVFTGKFSNHYPTLLLTVLQISFVTLFSGISAFLLEDWEIVFHSSVVLQGEVLIALLITSIFATALAFFAQTYFQRFTSAVHTALIFAMEPVFAAVTAYIVLQESLSMKGFIGSLLIFSGMILAELPSIKRKQKTATITE